MNISQGIYSSNLECTKNYTFEDEKNDVVLPVWFPLVGPWPFVVIDSRETLRRRSIVIERVLDRGSLPLFDDGVVMIIVAAVDGLPLSLFWFWERAFGAIRRRRTEPSSELSLCRSGVLTDKLCASSRCCCSTSHSCLYWLWCRIKLINGRLFSCKVRYKFSNKVILVRSYFDENNIKKRFQKKKQSLLDISEWYLHDKLPIRHWSI